MAAQIQFRRGTTVEISSFIGAVGEITVDTTKNTGVIHDGVQPGGYPILLENGINSALLPGSLSSCALKFLGDSNTGFISPGADQFSIVTGGVARLTADANGSINIPGNLAVTGNVSVTGDVNSSATLALIIALS